MKSRNGIAFGCCGIFIILAVLVKLNLVESFDIFCYNLVAFNINDTLTTIYKIITFFGSTPFIVGLCIFFFVLFLVMKKKNYGFLVAGFLILSTIVNNVIKVIIRRSRPLVLALVEESTFSFPSGHTMASASLYGILLFLVLRSNLTKNKKIILSILLILLPVLVGISRIYLGAHFATDIIGAFLVSSILLLFTTSLVDKKGWL